MPAIFATASDYIRNFWSGATMSQRVFIGALSTFVIAVFVGLIVWFSRPEFATLYSNLSPEDADRIVKSLEAQKISHRLEQDGRGTIILIPQDKVQSQRIKIAGEKLVTGQGVGFEIFDDVKMGLPEFVQKISYRRALEGELARTMGEFPSVESARVHLVIPNRSLFIEEQQKPSASVLVKLAGGKNMEARDVQAVVNLVTMAVEGLDKTRVSIADSNGKVLYQPDEEGSLNGLTRTQFDHKLLTQQNIERRIEELLMPVVGAGRVIARVNAELDFSQKTVRKEIYDPEKTVVRSEMRSEESTQGRASLEGGVPDPNFRGDGPSGTTSNQQATREQRTTNFEINKEEHSIVGTVGIIDRLTVAVIVDGTYEKNADGVTAFKPRSDEELKRIRQLVSNAVGLDSARGDTLEVSNIAFGAVDMDSAPSTASIITEYAMRLGKPLLNALLVFLFLIMIVRPVVLALIRPKVEGRMLEGLEGLPQSDERLALVEEDDEAVAATAMLEKIEDIKAHSLQLSEQNIEQAIGIIRSWLKEPAKSGSVPARAA
ncbi:MAG: flagellar M-ring protein FliF [Desulfovibrio sp.]|jgi:flagellar M-ring protein FliF|nr:flagellar M-ring protein FliF [Desulfovibrio sp.]